MLEVKLWLYITWNLVCFLLSQFTSILRDMNIYLYMQCFPNLHTIVHNVKHDTTYVIITQHLEYINKKYNWGLFLFSKMLYKYFNENKFCRSICRNVCGYIFIHFYYSTFSMQPRQVNIVYFIIFLDTVKLNRCTSEA